MRYVAPSSRPKQWERRGGSYTSLSGRVRPGAFDGEPASQGSEFGGEFRMGPAAASARWRSPRLSALPTNST
ncbi:hypothetical protein [Streptomyces sp. NPDC020747]|uniref:hypothetical protein n=1 Tax=Streptomyces sp. NPDC020747 TaxID=3365086 RepID=UPI00378762C3